MSLIVYRAQGQLLLSLVLPSQMATAQESMQLLISPVLAVPSICTGEGAYLAVRAALAVACGRRP